MNYKYCISAQTDPYLNLATEQFLMGQCVPGIAVLFLWQNDNTIVVGKNQDPFSECTVDEFLSSGGRIARRRSGGGAVYHDLGNLNYSILCTVQDEEKCRYHSLLIRALDALGIASEFNGRNDITVCGRKMSGNAAYSDGNAICQHGTVMVDTDISRMTSLLTPDKDKLSRNNVHSVAARVVNLKELYPEITVSDISQALIGVTNAERLEPSLNRRELEALTAHYSSKEWIFGGRE